MRSVRPWAGYVRVSHVGKRAGDRFHSPDDQAREIREWAAREGVPVEILPPELNQSGGRLDRPILTEAIEGIEAGRYAGLVVAYLSRATRSLQHMLHIYERVERAGGRIVTIAENFDATTADGQLSRNLRAAIDEHQRQQHVERFGRLRAAATERGIWQRRQTPVGYDRDPATRRLVPNGDAARVRRAFHERAAGAPIVRVAERLGLTPAGTRYMLANRVYLGELRVGEHVNEAAHPPLVTLDEFQAAQRDVARPARSDALGPSLLTGLVRCASCGHAMSPATAASPVYVCHRVHSGCVCPRPAGVTIRLLDEHVEAVALDQLRRLRPRSEAGDGGVKEARDRLARAERELRAFLDGVRAAGISPESFAAAARSRQAAVDEARTDLGVLLARRPVLPFVGSIPEIWEQLGVPERAQVLRGLVEMVVVAPAGRGRRVAIADRVRIVRIGSKVAVPMRRNAGRPAGLFPIVLDDIDEPDVLGPLGG